LWKTAKVRDLRGENVQSTSPAGERQGQNSPRQLREIQLREENLQKQLLETRQREERTRREMQQRDRNLERQLLETKKREENLQRQLSAVTPCEEDFKGQLQEMHQTGVNSQRQLREIRQREENSQRQLREIRQREENSQRQLREIRQRKENSQRQLREMQQREETSQRQLREMQQRGTNSLRPSREIQQRLENFQQQVSILERQVREKDQEVNELELSLSSAQQTINDLQRQEECDWVISRDEIQMTNKCLGKGGWGSVYEGVYCGCTVAVKKMHDLILSPHNIRLFEREMNIASKCRHPHLLQFIGATNDKGNALFIKELMEESLRSLLEQRKLSETEIRTISLDVARALNYLHQKKPEPIIHRDVSSANVLLWRQDDQWRGKVSDYGTANFMQQTMTVVPGAMIYSAPEVVTSNQTVKVSFTAFRTFKFNSV
ncbi:unnamed protein product, partial [Porites lobata]